MPLNSNLNASYFTTIPDAAAIYYLTQAGVGISDVLLSDVANAGPGLVALDGILVTAAHTAATTILVTDRAGTTLITINVPAAAAGTFIPIYIPLGSHGHGMRSPTIAGKSGFGIRTSNAGTLCTAFWRNLQRRG